MKALSFAMLAMAFSTRVLAAGPAPGFLDLSYVPQAKVKVTIPGFGSFDDDGDGYGLRGMVRAGEMLAFTGEYQTVTYDQLELDYAQTRLGIGVAGASGSGVFLEYVKGKFSDSSGSSDRDGYGIHGRLAGDVSPQVQLYGDLGYQKITDDFEDNTGLEFSMGGSVSLSPVIGLFADYRVSNLKGEDSDVEEKMTDLRAGVRVTFGG